MSSVTHVPLKVFCAYARRDIEKYQELKNHLAGLRLQRRIELWCDQEIFPGERWEKEIAKKLKNADIILLLISSDFLSSKYCYNTELTYALQRHAAREVRVVPIILRPCDWEFSPLKELQALPSNCEAIFKQGRDVDAAMTDVAKEIGRLAGEIDRLRRTNEQEKKDNVIATLANATTEAVTTEADGKNSVIIKRPIFIPSPDSPGFFQSFASQQVPSPEELRLPLSNKTTVNLELDANDVLIDPDKTEPAPSREVSQSPPTDVTVAKPGFNIDDPSHGGTSVFDLIRKQPLLASLYILLIFLIVGATAFGISKVLPTPNSQLTPTPGPNTTGPNYIDNTQILTDKISDGRYAFDISDPSKENAENAFWSGKSNKVSWSNLFTKHMLNDGESCIYAQDQKISGPFFIVVAAVTLDRPASDPTLSAGSGEEELQGICLRQMYYNNHLAKNAKMHMQVLVANIGTRFSTKDPNIVKQIQLLANNHTSNFLGVVGLPFSTTVNTYMPDFKSAYIPVISPGASSSEFDSKFLPYFHRVVSDTTEEGQYAAQYARQLLKQQNLLPAGNILVFQAYANQADPNSNEPYSTTLGQGFTSAFTPKERPSTSPYATNVTDPFQTLVDASINNYKLIFCACFSSEFSHLNKDLTAWGYQGIKMGGEALYDLEGYPENNQPSTTPDPSYKNIYFTSFAFPDEVSLLCKGGPCQDNPDGELTGFYPHFCLVFDSSHKATSHCPARPESHLMLSYDATSALLNAYKDVLQSGKQSISYKDMHPNAVDFQGITGQINFKSNSSNVVHKLILALCINNSSPPTAHLLGYSDKSFFETALGSSQQAPPNSCVDAF